MAALSGVRVLDSSRLLPGACAGLMLAELGADVIKVEDPRGGDPIRHLPPFVNGPWREAIVLAWFATFLVMAVVMFGSLFIAIGAACTDLKETAPDTSRRCSPPTSCSSCCA